MPLPRRGWVGWIEQHARPIGAVTVWVLIASAGIGALVANASGRHGGESPAAVGSSLGSQTPSAGLTGGTTGPGNGKNGGIKGGPGGNTGGPGGSTTTGGGGPTGGPGNGGGNPNGNPSGPSGNTACANPTQPKAKNGEPETGITTHEVTIGEIVTDSNNLPQQLHPTYEGLSAWANLVNGQGGICGRRVSIEYRNDFAGSTPGPIAQQQYYQELVSKVFAFVATESLFDNQPYNDSPPYDPRFKDPKTGEFVPDVGGLALGHSNDSYPRAQSNWHAGIIGSLSPVLTGGGPFHYLTHSSPGTKCRKAGVLYLNEPSGASRDQADVGSIALAASWGGGFGKGNVNEYSANLEQPEPAYEQTVAQMIGDGVNCAFTYMDQGSNVNLVDAMHNQGVWPPDQCTATRKAADQCFYLTYMPFTAADETFVHNAGHNGFNVSTWIPHVPLNESSPAVRQYLDALDQCNRNHYEGCEGDAKPSTFSVLGFASGVMFGEALQACGGAPTRDCVMDYLRKLQDFTADGLILPITPFQCTRATYNGNTWCWKWIFTQSVVMRELGPVSQGIDAFRRIDPAAPGWLHDTLHLVRGSPA